MLTLNEINTLRAELDDAKAKFKELEAKCSESIKHFSRARREQRELYEAEIKDLQSLVDRLIETCPESRPIIHAFALERIDLNGKMQALR